MANFAAETHPGRVYSHNEDTLAWLPERGVFLVADGMGGHASGEVASRVAADTFLASVPEMGLPDALRAAHRAVVAAAAADAALKGMGSTAVAVEIDAGRARFAWIGDSRGYLFRRGRLTQLTRDHSVLNLLLERGELTAADAARHPQRHVITQTLGHGEPEPDQAEQLVRAGDLVLLCSDGLSDELSDEDIAAILREHTDLAAAAKTLVERALAAGGRDNVSVVIVACGPEDAAGTFARLADMPTAFWPVVGGIAVAALLGAVWWVLESANLI
jgi:protein phosphatase